MTKQLLYKIRGVFFVHLLFCLIPTNAQAAIGTDIYGDFKGHVTLFYEYPIKSAESVSLLYESWTLEATNPIGSGHGLGGAYRFYFDSTFKGPFYGLGIIAFSYLLVQDRGLPSEKRDRAIVYAPFYEIGYALMLSKEFVITTSLKAQYQIGQFQGITFPDSGLFLRPQIQVTYLLL